MSDSRARLIESATDLFIGGGFNKVGVAEICKVARVNKGTFYHFFPSKVELLLVVLDEYTQAVTQQFVAVGQSDAEPHAKLSGIFNVPMARNDAWKAAHGVSSGCFVGNVILELASTEPRVRERAERAIAVLTEALRPIIEEFLVAQRIAGRDTRVSAEILMGLIQGAQVQAKVRNDPSVFNLYARVAPAIILSADAGKSAGMLH